MIFALVVAWLYTLIECIRTPRAEIRLLPKGLWILLQVLVPIVSTALYWLLGRPSRQQGGSGGTPARRAPRAPDDDPEFLRRVSEQAWRDRMEQRRRQRKEKDGQGPEGEPRPA